MGALQFAMDLDEANIEDSVLDKSSRFEKVNELLSKLENVETSKLSDRDCCVCNSVKATS